MQTSVCMFCYRNAASDRRHPGPRFSRLPDPHPPMGVLAERRSPSLHTAPRGDRGQGLKHTHRHTPIPLHLI